jgi:hypothetical protein
MQGTLVLRDIHQAAAPAWWPPAPGWWVLTAVLLGMLLLAWAWRRRKRIRERRIAGIFDDALAAAQDVPARIATMSELLRRAARRRDQGADKLQGEAWLKFLDAEDPARSFTQGAGKLLLEGGFRRDADSQQVDAVRELARARFIEWMVK